MGVPVLGVEVLQVIVQLSLQSQYDFHGATPRPHRGQIQPVSPRGIEGQ